MNKKCFACDNDKWKYLCKGFDYSGNGTITCKCCNCGHLRTVKEIDVEESK